MSQATQLVPLSQPALPVANQNLRTVSTRMLFPAGAERVWEGLMFYEQVESRPPLVLRLLLPVPIRTVGRKSVVGDEARCLYGSGHLVKRVTEVVPGRLYAFAVVEQALAIGGLRLLGGQYALCERSPASTEVTLLTHYASPRRPAWLWRGIEALVCHAFHRHILRAMRKSLRS